MLKSCYRSYFEAGTDEAGRGCLAGPVTAAAITLPENFNNNILNDSKQLSEAKRTILRPILEKEAVSFSVCHVFEDDIDEINILNASFLAMHRAIDKLVPLPSFLIVDGNRFKPYPNIDHECIVKGDGKYMSIAAASVLAKTYRDEYMAKIHEEFPMYNWKKNKGYPTKEHREAIKQYGLTKYHRKSFRQLPEQLTLDI
ncbi:Ribonuclease H [Allomuricauda ruestringensis DSM 13258]|uniref:Ribonuclease HII n=1 Tax=Allomuricauda ruestringensis (strain DSM 13258 / CIP 107369 / LMG 19739 / B1) TaxID=886377 RepID=G2PJQ7_ALLRU|nr:ribonuclease HII [Allomuricauda ruestringensis]AEM69815.1 Ribonuclease H [Allomuricauda ruestringensis DSM 13258]